MISSHKYSRITLKPNSEEEKALFWQFRCDDIADTLIYFVIFNSCFWAGNVLAFVTGPSPASLTKVILYSIFLVLYVTVWKIRNRFKKQLVYTLMFLYIYMQILLYTLSSSALIEATPEDDE